jgi:protein-S-isoprenylcysteine O-methyltransferase Ste14
MTGRQVHAPPEAQGPAYEQGEMEATGPFRRHRHPLNFAPLPVLWLFPHMTSRLAAMNLASTAYLVLGSIHEEARLHSAYGTAYKRYLASGVPFYAPRLHGVRWGPRLVERAE